MSCLTCKLIEAVRAVNGPCIISFNAAVPARGGKPSSRAIGVNSQVNERRAAELNSAGGGKEITAMADLSGDELERFQMIEPTVHRGVELQAKPDFSAVAQHLGIRKAEVVMSRMPPEVGCAATLASFRVISRAPNKARRSAWCMLNLRISKGRRRSP